MAKKKKAKKLKIIKKTAQPVTTLYRVKLGYLSCSRSR